MHLSQTGSSCGRTLALLFAIAVPAGADPSWWSDPATRIWTSAPQNVENGAPVNLGQLKHVAEQARRFMDSALPQAGGAGAAITAMSQFTQADNYAPATVGQLKNVAQVFYDRLGQIGYNWQTSTFGIPSTPYPWTGTVHPENEAPCNIGQLKNVFTFDIAPAFLATDDDGDGLPTWWEFNYGMDPAYNAGGGSDGDGDRLSDLNEYLNHTNPTAQDTDGDSLPDGWEIQYGLNPLDNGSNSFGHGANGDPDGDGLINLQEFQTYDYEAGLGTSPNLADTDSDGLNDGEEYLYYFTAPFYADPDFDGLNDYEEVILYGTDPFDDDTDADYLRDGEEVHVYSTSPVDVDTDGDWIWDWEELYYGLDPTDIADGLLDADGDTIPNQLEFVFSDEGYDLSIPNVPSGFPWMTDPDDDKMTTLTEFNSIHRTHPRKSDTDGDGYNDGWEIAVGFNPKANDELAGPPLGNPRHPDADPDGDGLTNAEEEQLKTNPNNADSDGDWESDKVERDQGSNPNDPNDSNPPPNGTVPVHIQFGDPSDSNSEKYKVLLTPMEGDFSGERFRTNRKFGDPQTDTFHLHRGAKYSLRLIHIQTNLQQPDYDYILDFPSENGIVVDDPQGIVTVNGDSYEFFAKGKEAYIYVPLFKLQRVSFTGSTIGDLTPDNSIIPYGGPHWEDANTDGDASDPGDRAQPIAYVRNTNPQVSAAIKVAPSSLTSLVGFSAKIRGESVFGMVENEAIPVSVVELAAFSPPYTGPQTAGVFPINSMIFPDEISNIDPMSIDWKVQLNGAGEWLDAGSSSNRTYVTLAIPNTTRREETIFDLACRNANGKTDPILAFGTIWDDFKPDADLIPRVQRVMRPNSVGPEVFAYYPDSAFPYNASESLDDLLAFGHGRCGPFRLLFKSVLNVHGISVTDRNVYAPGDPVAHVNAAKADYISTFGSDPTSTHIIALGFFIKNWSGVSTGARWAASNVAGIAGQGNPDPISFFNDHALIQFAGQIYDPSYGKGPFASVAEWEDNSIIGFGVYFVPNTGQSAGIKYWTRSMNVPNSEETTPQPP